MKSGPCVHPLPEEDFTYVNYHRACHIQIKIAFPQQSPLWLVMKCIEKNRTLKSCTMHRFTHILMGKAIIAKSNNHCWTFDYKTYKSHSKTHL